MCGTALEERQQSVSNYTIKSMENFVTTSIVRGNFL